MVTAGQPARWSRWSVMNFSMSAIFTSLVTGTVGYAYFRYGKRMTRPVFIAAGIGLMVFPYFVDSIPLSIILGSTLAALPFIIKI
jgi:ABC-type glycerol-3-phosphate transport system permease component